MPDGFTSRMAARRYKLQQWRKSTEGSYELAQLDATYLAHQKARQDIDEKEARMNFHFKIVWYLSAAHNRAVRNLPWCDFPEPYLGPDGHAPWRLPHGRWDNLFDVDLI